MRNCDPPARLGHGVAVAKLRHRRPPRRKILLLCRGTMPRHSFPRSPTPLNEQCLIGGCCCGHTIGLHIPSKHPQNWLGRRRCVMTLQIGETAPEFDKRGVKIIGLSVDPVDNHAKWANDIKETQGFAPNYPMIGDTDFNVSKLYGMLPASTSGDAGKRTAADNQTV